MYRKFVEREHFAPVFVINGVYGEKVNCRRPKVKCNKLNVCVQGSIQEKFDGDTGKLKNRGLTDN